MTWWALAMTFGSIPGICFVSYCFGHGYESRGVSWSDFIGFLRRMYRVKDEAIRETGRALGGRNAAMLALLIAIALACVATDAVVLIAVNVSAILVGVLAYRMGIRVRVGRHISIEDARLQDSRGQFRDGSDVAKAVGLLMVAWVALVVSVLGTMYGLGLWGT
jgi:hypothetical protein